MSTSDTQIPFSKIDGLLRVINGAGLSLEIIFVQSDLDWKEEGAPYTEAKTRNKHQATPILRKTGDGNVTGSAKLLVTSFRGATVVTPYEVLTDTGLASAYTSTAAGDRKAKKLEFYVDASAAAGASQTVAFNFAVVTNVSVSPGGEDGLFGLSFDFVDHEERPTIT